MRKVVISLGLILVMAVTSGCTPEEVKQLEGIIQNVDTVKGEITIVTKDGETVTLDVDTGASVEAEGGSSNLETLEVGASIQVDVKKDNQVVQSIKAQQAEIEGEIVQLAGDEVTVETEDGERITILVSEDTRIDTEDASSGTSRSLQVGEKIETRYDPESKEAFTVSGQEEESEVDEDVIKSPTTPPDIPTPPTVDVPSVAEYVADALRDLEAYKAKTEQGIADNRISGIYDAEWMKNAQAEVDRIADMIADLKTPGKYTEEFYNIVIIDGVPIIQEDNEARIRPEIPVEGEPIDDGGGDGDGHDDDDHDDGGDDHSD